MKSFDLAIIGGGLGPRHQVLQEAGGEGSIALFSRTPRCRTTARRSRRSSSAARRTRSRSSRTSSSTPTMGSRSCSRRPSRASTPRHELEVDGDRLAYGKLLLATGAWPRQLEVPGSDLDGIFTLRTVGNSKAIRDAAAGAERAVVVGAGFIGMEVAASLRQIGKEVSSSISAAGSSTSSASSS